MIDKKKIVFFTGAGMSRESGLPTFRGEGGVWNEIDYEKVATLKSWYGRQRKYVKERRQAMLDFFNSLRRAILEHEPNEGHRIIVALENDFEVIVITQNCDDYHTRAGSSKVIYLHGEALKNASSANPSLSYPIDRSNPDIEIDLGITCSLPSIRSRHSFITEPSGTVYCSAAGATISLPTRCVR